MSMLPPKVPAKNRRSRSSSISPPHGGRSPSTTRVSLDSGMKKVSSQSPRKSRSPVRKSYPVTADETANTSCTTFEEKKQEDDVGPGSKFHDALEDRDWEKLEALLKKYDAKYWKRMRQRQQSERALTDSPKADDKSDADDAASGTTPPPSPGSLRKSRALSMFKSFSQSPSRRRIEKEKNLTPPLLTKDREGRTPLHLALLYRCPEKILMQMVSFERTAAGVQDIYGRTPLHVGVEKRALDHVLEKIIKAHPNALKTKDLQGRSPVGLAVEFARELQEEQTPEGGNSFCWGTPTSPEESDWQFKQDKIWNKVTFLLKDLMKRNKCVIPSEHGLILEALEGGAPPRTINRFISTADKYLMVDDDLAGSSISLCTKRRYCLDTFEYLLENCRERTTMITDYTHKALVTHYRFGCHPQKKGETPYGKELIDMAQRRSEEGPVNEEEPAVEEGEEKEKGSGDEEGSGEKKQEKKKRDELDSVSDACKEWWETMRHIIFYCAYGKEFKSNESVSQEKHLLHAALAIAATPPSLVQLILVLHPDARSELCPVFKALPIHIMCTRWKHDILHKEKDKTMERVIKHFLKPNRELMARRHRGRLPIHLALDVGQAWSFLKPVVGMDKKAVGMRDPHSKLFPFQMAAIKFSSNNIAMFLRNQYTPGEWRVISTQEKRAEYAIAENAASLRQIGTIFELLRRFPDAIVGKVLSRDEKFSRDLEGVGPVSKIYLSWVYGRGSRGWKLRPANVKLLRDSILNANISKALTPWWDRLKHYIWQSSKNDSLPHTDEYLLHAALYNPDTPPLVIELLLELYPMSAAKCIPGTEIYPLHIAAATTPYRPQPFEIPNKMDNVRLTLSAYKGAVRMTHHGRLPLHICIARGKTWVEMKPLVQQYRQSLMIVDPQTGLAPFQLMSIFKMTSKEHSLRFSNIAARQARAVDLDSMTVQDRGRFLMGIKKKHDLDALTAIYELLRNGPDAIYALTSGQTTDDASIDTPEVVDDTATFNRSSVLGVAATLDKFLQDLSPSRRDSVQNFILSPEKKRKSLGSFFRQEDNARHLVTPTPGRPSLSSFLGSGHSTSGRSLVSRQSGVLHDDYVKPTYDDDVMSSMGASMSSSMSSFLISPGAGLPDDGSTNGSSRTPGRTPGTRRGRRPSSPKGTPKTSRLPIALPDLG